MSPPNPLGRATPVDPLHAGDAAPPPPPAGPVIRPVSADAVPQPGVASPPPAGPEAAASTYEYTFWRRLHLNVVGGYNFQTRIFPDAEPFRRAAPAYSGGHIGLQPSVSLLQPGVFDFRLGVDWRTRVLSIPRSAGSVDSSVTAMNLGILAEANVYFHQAIGLGAQVNLGYAGLISSNADVGAPHSASFDFGQQGGLGVGFMAYLNFWRGAFRLGGGVDLLPTGFALPAGGTNPDLQVSVQPQWNIFAGVDIFQLIRNGQGGERFGAPQ